MATYPLLPYSKVMPNEQPGVTTVWAQAAPAREWQPPDLDPFHKADEGRDPATSFPDPFYRREATRLALQRADGPYHRLWGIATQALASGLLRVEMVDLANDRGALGRALLRLHPERRFLAHFYGEVKGQRLLFALGDPEILLWPAARRLPEQWSELERQVDAAETHPRAVLADLAATLRAAGAWNPEAVLWQRAISLMLDGMAPTPGLSTYREHSRSVGPFPLRLTWEGHDEIVPVWWPVYERGWGQEILRLASMRLRVEGDAALAAQGSQPARLRVHLPGGTDDAAIFKGRGVVSRVGSEPLVPVTGVTLAEADGLFDVLGRTVYPDHALEVAEVRRWPMRHPDPVRVLVDALGAVGLPARALKGGVAGASYGQAAVLGALQGGRRLPSADELIRDGGGFVLRNPHGPDQLFLDHAERYGVTELTELGWVLWEAFLGSVTVGSADVKTDLRIGSTVQLRVRRDGRPEPLELPPLDAELKAEVGRRLATLQRFARAWSLEGTTPVSGEAPAQLLAAAAAAWVRWATGAEPFPNGPPARDHLRWPLPGANEDTRLPVDPVGRATR
ncbi:MAG: hypothetical protein H6741_05790 [Alphaproteobacteria bacterium]|nr:hypothetical protein [Alphaproteobacteria bacterium]MCB9792219.1 hypothetical protein [Alphaproteobacteria bacterium]